MNKIFITCIVGAIAWCAASASAGTLIDIDREQFYDNLWEGYRKAVIEKNMENATHAEDSINSALEDFWEQEHGSNGSTKSEELLQLPSSVD